MSGDERYLLISVRGKRYLKRASGSFNTSKHPPIDLSKFREGELGVDASPYHIFKPNLEDIILYGFKRATQIIYPKDSFYALLRIGVGPGGKVLEVGTGSGAVTAVLSHLVGAEGEVITCDRREDMLSLAQKNLRKFNFPDNVRFLKVDLGREPLPIEDESVDAAFVDVRHPWEVIDELHRVLVPSGNVAFLVPTTNQVSQLLRALSKDKKEEGEPEGDTGIASGRWWGDIEVIEINHRRYKPVPDRLRPDDQLMVHTGYLIFSRKISRGEEASHLKEVKGG